MKPTLLTLAALCSAFTLAATDNLIRHADDGTIAAADFPGAKLNTEETASGKGSLEFADRKWVLGKQHFIINPQRTYTLSLQARSADAAAPSNCFFGIAMYDKDGKLITAQQIGTYKGSDTILNLPVTSGDKEITVQDASKWRNNMQVAFNTKEDYSDLPNREVWARITKIEKLEAAWKITLSHPVKKDYPAGTGVRTHTPSSGHCYALASGRNIPGQWTEYRASFTGRTHEAGPNLYKGFWPGAASFVICIVPNYNKKIDSTLLIDNLSVTITD